MKARPELLVLLLLAVVLIAPWLMRPADRGQGRQADDTLVIITPHGESIRQEFTTAFSRYYQNKTGRTVHIDWRIPGGTSEIAMVIRSSYRSAFEYYWTNDLKRDWENDVGAFWDGSTALPDPAVPPDQVPIASQAREAFLTSNLGIGLDLFFGGGAYDFIQQAKAGALVSATPDGRFGLEPIAAAHPAWFEETIMPMALAGEELRDSKWRWVGTCLSGFGLVSNTDMTKRLGWETPPNQWRDLADPRLFRQVALADPTKSGSAAKAFEMIIQQQMNERLQELQVAAIDAKAIEAQAVEEGWDRGMQLILNISANGRYFTDSATKVPHDVAMGEGAAGMSIDFYGRTFNEIKRDAAGDSRIHFEMPVGGTSVGADPIGMFRGAPHPEVAHMFMEFALSTEGQRLWNHRVGTPGGPVKTALRRLPIRKDIYQSERQWFSDPKEDPWKQAETFTYQFAWTGSAFNSLRFIIRVACVEPHVEQRDAWQAIIEAGFPPEALAKFLDVSMISRSKALGEIAATLKSKDRIKEVQLARQYAAHFRNQYEEARRLAIEGK